MAYTSGGSNIGGQFGMPLYGMGGLMPFGGNYFFVNGTGGSDGNTGGPQDPFATLSQALSVCTAGNNDVVLLTGQVAPTATVNWSKNATHLIGLAPALQNYSASRIVATTGTVFTPLVNVTATDCIFRNIAAVHGFANASTQICWTDAGGRNEYTNCAISGMANATAGAQAGGRSLLITGATGDNTFRDCRIGTSGITSAAANASLEFAAATPRNNFIRCMFPRLTSSATTLHVLATGAAAMSDFQWFQDCNFVNIIKTSSTQMTVAISMTSASPGGLILLQRCSSIGATKWGDTNALANTYVDGGAPAAATSGLAINPS